MPTITRRLTAEEYGALPDDDVPTELVRGRIVELNRPFTSHGAHCLQIGYLFKRYLEEHDIGRAVGGDAGVITERDPDTVRGPDVAYYSYDRIPKGPMPKGYWEVAPEIAVEVRSPTDRWKKIMKKVGEYLDAGVLAVVVADPETQVVQVFSSEASEVEVLRPGDRLSFPAILPGFSILVEKLFE